MEFLERSTEEWECNFILLFKPLWNPPKKIFLSILVQKSFGIVKDKHSLPIEIVPIANTKKLEPNYVLKKKKVQKEKI